MGNGIPVDGTTDNNQSESTLYNNDKDMSKYERSIFWDDEDKAKFTFFWVIIFSIGLYLLYNLVAFLERCRHKIRRPFNPWRLLRSSLRSRTSETAVTPPDSETGETSVRRNGRPGMASAEERTDVAEFMFPPVHYRTVNGILLEPSPLHVPRDKNNQDVEEIVVFLPLISLSPPSSSMDLSNLDHHEHGDRVERSSNMTFGSDRHTV